MEKILIIEDDEDIRDILKLYLEGQSYEILEAENGAKAMKQLVKQPDLVILDLMLPDIDGLSICKSIRKKYYYPIIMITAKNADQDKILGLSYGADDYITKPFNPLEVVARVKAQLRRYKQYDENITDTESIYYKALTLNQKSKQVSINEKEIKLTPTEFKILEALLKRKGEVLSGEELFNLIWEDEYYSKSTNTITVHVRNLREKMDDSFEKPEYIKTVWGVGYIIEA
ncbi:response regulator transcription factor [Clostridium botulinum]|uniref:Stage 0 sporulation protein A homolog n=1 Tax=Clostridium botulinum (strain Okra / Type B1) TaxID=498213 RepID=B1IE96_CLOBK|nr:response regulator transcription factor [Clostridium botulinum]EKX81354.1 regulatory protein VanR [Clostridium botulinum CFSAN001628]ACA44212.1 regulatory protein VanR [Clostridium botulinum B1 str. Okra]MBD5561560.1 response regulator transcription factor [Clostridium botulinum]MBD5564934.1 response regulator transcription factor [Clostridium botulinum]MBD5571188.1 response regulator transcription factor [Clostridium botulinum]